MNLFRLCGDVSHVVSIVVLLCRLTALQIAIACSRRHILPLLLAAGATIPSDTTNAYLCKVAAVGFPAYEKAHRKALVALAEKSFPRLPTEVAAQVVAFAFHVGYY